MLTVSSDEVLKQTREVESVYKESSLSPLLFDKFLEKSYNSVYKDFTPYEVRIPKSLDKLLRGDKEPERIIKVDKPLTYKDRFPLWQGDSTDGINIRGLGYKNGDSRYPSDLSLDDTDIHMLLGGATGHGKSVTLNSIVFGIAMEYAPWEVKMTLIDSKIVEFKRYARGGILPHISSIAATGDAEYLISVLEDLKNEMMRVNQMFTVYGEQNIKGFRKSTGLTFPRNIIIMDELQTGYKNAGKKASKIDSLIDDFARLGRSTGYHLILSSQEPGELTDKTLGNVKVRAALGCLSNVSEKILGNDEAKINYGFKGRIVINTNPGSGDKRENEHFRVPFQDGNTFSEQKKELSKMGDDIGFRYNLSFYDEESILEEPQYKEFVRTKVDSVDKIYLGEPSFVLRDPDGDNYVKLDLKGDDIENILVYCPTSYSVERYSKMLKYNVEMMGSKAISNVFYADKPLYEKLGLEGLGSNQFNIKSSDDHTLGVFIGTMYRRKLCIEADQIVFTSITTSEITDEYFYECFEKGSEFDTELNRGRANAILDLLTEEVYMKSFGHQDMMKEDLYNARLKLLKECILFYKHAGCGSEKMNLETLPPIFNWIIGIEKILGWGRDSKYGEVERLKKVLQDSISAKVRFIITTTSMEDLESIRSGIRYCIMEGLGYSEARKVGCEEFPEQVSPVLGVLYDRYGETREAVKFKKMAFKDEILVG